MQWSNGDFDSSRRTVNCTIRQRLPLGFIVRSTYGPSPASSNSWSLFSAGFNWICAAGSGTGKWNHTMTYLNGLLVLQRNFHCPLKKDSNLLPRVLGRDPDSRKASISSDGRWGLGSHAFSLEQYPSHLTMNVSLPWRIFLATMRSAW